MNIALYARVSSETQAKEGTIDSQIEALRDYAKTHKLTITHECIDDGYSGTTLERPGLDRLRDLAQAGSIEGVLILAPDRLSRKQANQILLTEEFKKRDVKLLFTTQTYADTPEYTLTLQIQGAIAEYEREKILDRMRRGIIHSVKNGQVNGSNAPYGYKYVNKTKDSRARWEVIPHEASIVQLIYRWYIRDGMKGTQIADRLNNDAIPSRSQKWWSSQIYSILKNEVYTGTAYMFKYRSVEPKKNGKRQSQQYRKRTTARKLRPKEEWIAVPVTPIIEKATWEMAQKLLKQNAYRARRNNNKHNYLLRRLVICGLCGSMASGYVSNKSTFYSCGAKRNKNITSKPHDELIQVKHESFDQKVWSGLTELLGNPENLKVQIENRMHTSKPKIQEVQPSDESEKELVRLANEEKRILDAYREEVITLDDLKEQKAKIAQRRRVAESKKKAIQSPPEAPEQRKITMDMLGDISARFQRAMAKADFAKREKLVNLLVNSVTLFPDKAIVKGNIPINKFDVLNPSILRCRFFV